MLRRLPVMMLLLALCAAGQNRSSSLTIYPASIAGREFPRASEVIALMLERGGMERLEVADRGAPLATEFALSAEFAVEPGKGFTEVRASITDRAGNAVWSTRATPEDADWKKLGVREPMECVQLLVERLRPVLGLGDPSRQDAPRGKFARLMEQRSGLPPAEEREAIKPRLDSMRRSGPAAELVVYAPNAAVLARMIEAGGLAKARAAGAGPAIEPARDMNEQRILWDQARAFREYARKNPAQPGYALYASYLGTAAVHFIVCDSGGDWVIVDFQNEHHPDYQSIAPKSEDDCARLVVKRLAGYLRQ